LIGCSKVAIVGSPNCLRISSHSGPGNVYEVCDKKAIESVVDTMNKSSGTPRKFKANLEVRLIYNDHSQPILVNGHCFSKEAISYCGEADLEALLLSVNR
jgi:hypothetical protein